MSVNKHDLGEKGNRVTVYDWLRLIATIFVVIGHSAYLNIQTTYGGVDYQLQDNLNNMYYSVGIEWIRHMSVWVYGFHMPLFFMLSGAVMALKPIKNFDSMVKGKIKRLLVPYFVYGWLFMLPIKRLGNFYNNETLRLAFKGFLLGADSGHLWFLTALFWCIIAFLLIIKILNKINVNSLYVILGVSGIILFTYMYIPFDVLNMKMGLSYLFYFSLGYVFENERKTNGKWNIKNLILALLIIFLVEIINEKFDILSSFFVILIGSFMTYVMAAILDRLFANAYENKLWKIVTRNLFYVYIFHDPLEYIVLRIFFNSNLLKNSFGCIAYVIARTVVIFIISVLLGEIIEFIKKKFVYLLK